MNFPTDITIAQLDFAKGLAKFENNNSKKIAMAKIKSGGKKFVVDFMAEMATKGINVHVFEDGKKAYSVGLELTDDLIKIIGIYEAALIAFAPTYFEYVDCIKDDDRLFVKIKVDASGKSFTCKSNVKMTPSSFSEPCTCSTIQFIGDIECYFNFENSQMGLCFNARTLNFE